jgi:hypothetical protein
MLARLRSHVLHREIWAEGAAQLGLQPLIRGVWALLENRPGAQQCHRYQWGYPDGFWVSELLWVCPWFCRLLSSLFNPPGFGYRFLAKTLVSSR